MSSLRVAPVAGLRRLSVRSRGGGVIDTGGIDATYSVAINNVTVFIGNPNAAAALQDRIDAARTTRMVGLYGRVRPYGSSD